MRRAVSGSDARAVMTSSTARISRAVGEVAVCVSLGPLGELQSRVMSVIYSVLKFFSPCRGGWGLGGAIFGDIMVAPEIFVFTMCQNQSENTV